MFYKFLARLHDLEKKHGQIATRKIVKTKNKFGNTMKYAVYSAIDKTKLISILKE